MSDFEAIPAAPSHCQTDALHEENARVNSNQHAAQRWHLSGAPRTMNQYGAVIVGFEVFCRATGVEARPATPETVAAFLRHRRTNGNVGQASLNADARAIRRAHLACGLPDPTDHPAVRDALGRKRKGLQLPDLSLANDMVLPRISPKLAKPTVPQQDPALPDTALTLEEIDPVVDFYKFHSIANATRFSYARAIREFRAFCRQHDFCPLPAEVETVCRFLAEYGDTRKPSTLTIAKAAIRWVHRSAGMCSPTDHPDVEIVMRGHARTKGTRPAKKYALTSQDIVAMCKAMDEEGGVIAIRDRAFTLLGFGGAFRSSEITHRDVYYDEQLVCFEIKDTTFNRHGAMITVRKSKTDQNAEGQEVFITYGCRKETCAVVALQCWLELLESRGFTSGPVFRSCSKIGDPLRGDVTIQDRPLGRKDMVRRLKYWAQKIGLDPATIGGHSLRAGHVTVAAQNGASIFSIAEQGRWKDMDTVREYYRRATAHRDNSSSALGL